MIYRCGVSRLGACEDESTEMAHGDISQKRSCSHASASMCRLLPRCSKERIKAPSRCETREPFQLIIHLSKRGRWTALGPAVCVAIGLSCSAASAQVAVVSGAGTAGSPYVLSGSGDITSYVVANSYIQLGGGTYTIDIPASGTGVTTAGNGTTIVAGDGNIASTTPVITYSGVISGTGQVIVTNATSTVQPSLYNKLSGGALLVTNALTFTNPSGSTFVVDANTLLSINGGSIPAGSALTNNGEIYANKDGYTFTKIDGAGNIVLENDDLNEAHVSGINTISGNSLLLYGEYINAGTVLPESLSIISDDIDVIKNGGSATNSFFITIINRITRLLEEIITRMVPIRSFKVAASPSSTDRAS